jgi:hypothetical protein
MNQDKPSSNLVRVLNYIEYLITALLVGFFFFVFARGLGNVLPDFYDEEAEAMSVRHAINEGVFESNMRGTLTEREAIEAYRDGYRSSRRLQYYAEYILRLLTVVLSLAVSLTVGITWLKFYRKLPFRTRFSTRV